MRDVNRIQPFCNELAKLWAKCPDMRFGQFMLNVFGEIASKGVDPFFRKMQICLTKSRI